MSTATCGEAICWSEVDVLQARQLRHLLLDDRRPVVELRRIGRGQRVLVLRLAEPAADIDVLARLHEELHARHLGHLGPQPLDDLLRRGIAVAERLELDEHAGGVLRRVAAGRADEAHHAADAPDPSGPCRRARWRGPAIACEGDVLPRLGLAEDEAGVLLGEEALGDDDVEIAGEADQQRGSRPGSGTGGATPIAGRGRRSAQRRRRRPRPSGSAGRACGCVSRFRKRRAHHRRQRQRDEGRHDDGDRDDARRIRGTAGRRCRP